MRRRVLKRDAREVAEAYAADFTTAARTPTGRKGGRHISPEEVRRARIERKETKAERQRRKKGRKR